MRTDTAPMIDFTPADEIGRRVMFTPGPVTCTRTVLEAGAVDIGSWDSDTTDAVEECRRRLLAICHNRDDLAVTLLPGSGTYGVEAVMGSAVPQGGKILILRNGMYGQRLVDIATELEIDHVIVDQPENIRHDAAAVDAALTANPDVSHVVTCHCETTSGVLNRLDELGPIVARHGKRMLVDAMATFAGYEVGPGAPIDFDAAPIDHIVASANKCVQGVPGLSYIISRKDALTRAAGNARSMSLDVAAQNELMNKTGRFRYTPPTHALRSFLQALRELEAEGGVPARAQRYRENQQLAIERLGALGIRPYVDAEHRSHVNTTFLYPTADFDFVAFKDGLRSRGYIIFPQKVTRADTFRVGSIGNIGPAEVIGLTNAIADTLGLARPE
jgi:2-aminoethylphosphonate-pyruvate transaminase